MTIKKTGPKLETAPNELNARVNVYAIWSPVVTLRPVSGEGTDSKISSSELDSVISGLEELPTTIGCWH